MNLPSDVSAKTGLQTGEAPVSRLAIEAGLLGAEMHRALRAILREPYGCVFCDSGKLRNPAKGHDEECGFAMAQKLVGETSPAPQVGTPAEASLLR